MHMNFIKTFELTNLSNCTDVTKSWWRLTWSSTAPCQYPSRCTTTLSTTRVESTTTRGSRTNSTRLRSQTTLCCWWGMERRMARSTGPWRTPGAPNGGRRASSGFAEARMNALLRVLPCSLSHCCKYSSLWIAQLYSVIFKKMSVSRSWLTKFHLTDKNMNRLIYIYII